MNKLNSILQLANDIQTQISKNEEEWKRYLCAASKQYKYAYKGQPLTYDEQILIYAQRPDATICAPIELWNKNMNCLVNRGSKGIAIIDKYSDNLGLKYLFDVTDVHKYNSTGKLPFLWVVNKDHEDYLISNLEAIYGKTDINKVFEERIIEIANTIADNSIEEYITTLDFMKDNSFLADFDSKNIEVIFKNLLSSSIAYSILVRCNSVNQKIIDELNFEGIYNFNTPETLTQLGTATTESTRQLLTNTAKIIRDYELNKLKENQPVDKQPMTEESRGNSNESNISGSRRLFDTRLKNGETTGKINREIRQNEEALSNERKEGSIPESPSFQPTEGSSIRDRRAGQSEDRLDNGGYEKGTEYYRGNESPGSDKLDTKSEQHKASSGRNSSEGDYIQLTLFPTIQQQKEAIEIGELKQSPFSMSDKKNPTPKYSYIEPKIEKYIPPIYIERVLKNDKNEYEKNIINEIFKTEPDPVIRAKLIKEQYGQGGFNWPKDGFDLHGYDTTQPKKGIRFQWKDEDGEKIGYLSWATVEKEIEKLIHSGTYLDKEVVDDELFNNDEDSEIQTDDNIINEQDEDNNIASSYDNPIFDEPKEIKELELDENFIIEDLNIQHKNDREKFKDNFEAIKTLKEIESENRSANKLEKQILSKYIGWGGLPQAFDESIENWKNEVEQLKSILSQEEYESARASTLNAHYTPSGVIKCIYEKIESMGFTKGNILEPAVGVGYFLGLLPESMKESKLYAAELDDITGRIAKKLYPNASIEITGFENTSFKNDSFDLAIGNVPFGNYKVADKQYDKLNFMIHDYFFAKTLDKVRPGGLVAFITSKGTMDKKSNQVRKYIAQRAELIGAVRLPNNAFAANAGTEVTSDIIFLKKRDRAIETDPDWLHIGLTEDGIPVNEYFINNPHMILGKMENKSGPFGLESTCSPIPGLLLEDQLRQAFSQLGGEISQNVNNISLMENDDAETERVIPADPNVNNFSFSIINDDVYFRENSIMIPIEESEINTKRIKALIGIRDCTRDLISYQLENYPDADISNKQKQLNTLYDDFTKDFGLINSKLNRRAFRDDSSYFLLCSLEILNEDGTLKNKADIFTKRTIKQKEIVKSVDTASDALALSLSHKACIDFEYMSDILSNHPSKTDLIESLQGVIFKDPLTAQWETSDEYLSGNVREKLKIARTYAENNPEYIINVESLQQVQPKDLEVSEIDVRLGATWIEPDIIKDFTIELLKTPKHLLKLDLIDISFSNITGSWNVKGKSADSSNVIANVTYGTKRANAYRIIEDTLNLKDVRIYDTIIDADGKEKRELNKKETYLAQQKQDLIKEAFKEWIFKTPERREKLGKKYNEIFNSTRPREFDGKYLTLDGMNTEITLRKHQLNTVARIVYGKNNTLAAHCVGAGKTYMMIAAAMESKRLGLAQKSLFVVPNHLIDQWTNDFLNLYPGANILAATKKDFEPANRKKFCSRIATGDYDAIIIGHSQFEKVPLSDERQRLTIKNQIDEISIEIRDLKESNGEKYTIKQMEKTKKSLDTRLQKLNDTSRKDNVVTFEELGVDRLFVDEAHSYKNLFLYTKMRNVAGISQTEAQKSSDMFAKCQYIDEITGGKGIIFATGTPISNSMTELYTMMRYLQFDKLKELNLTHFDSWASTFGETVTAIELAPEGTGYRIKTRFANFFNIPELISIFKESADIQTPDMLNLPVPEVEYKDIVTKPSDSQKEVISSLAERAEKVRNQLVDANVDNMLKITNDGRKLALDQRLINPLLEDFLSSKVNECVNNLFDIWENTTAEKLTQLVFCDLSTPKDNGSFSVYHDIKQKLIAKGIPEKEIAFIHDAKTDLKKAELFSKVRKGSVRILIGSTSKMGAGTNVQDKLVALHHLDVPWKPSDIEQQEGRIIRQGNLNKKVMIYRYITEGTFDAYSWQLIENKQRFISQIMTSKSPVRSCEDLDEATLSFAEVKALASGNPLIKEKMDLDIQVSKLKMLKANYLSQKYSLEDKIAVGFPQEINKTKEYIKGFEKDILLYNQNKSESFNVILGGPPCTDKKEAGEKIIEFCNSITSRNEAIHIGEYCGFSLNLEFDSINKKFWLYINNALRHKVELGLDPAGNITRIDNNLASMESRLLKHKETLETLENQLENAKEEVKKPFTKEGELNEKMARLNDLNSLLSLDDKKDSGIVMDKKQAKLSVELEI